MFEEGLLCNRGRRQSTTTEQIAATVRAMVYTRSDFNLSKERVESAIHDPNVMVRVALIQRFDWIPTKEQERDMLDTPYHQYTSIGIDLSHEIRKASHRWNAMREKKRLEVENGACTPVSKKRTL
jgi:hypothetical protein